MLRWLFKRNQAPQLAPSPSEVKGALVQGVNIDITENPNVEILLPEGLTEKAGSTTHVTLGCRRADKTDVQESPDEIQTARNRRVTTLVQNCETSAGQCVDVAIIAAPVSKRNAVLHDPETLKDDGTLDKAYVKGFFSQIFQPIFERSAANNQKIVTAFPGTGQFVQAEKGGYNATDDTKQAFREAVKELLSRYPKATVRIIGEADPNGFWENISQVEAEPTFKPSPVNNIDNEQNSIVVFPGDQISTVPFLVSGIPASFEGTVGPGINVLGQILQVETKYSKVEDADQENTLAILKYEGCFNEKEQNDLPGVVANKAPPYIKNDEDKVHNAYKPTDGLSWGQKFAQYPNHNKSVEKKQNE